MYHDNIIGMTLRNNKFRDIVYTGKHIQLVVMCLHVDEEIGEEVHQHVDQAIFIVDGEAEANVDEERFSIYEEDVVMIPAGSKHNIKNIGNKDLKLYSIYSPPEHG